MRRRHQQGSLKLKNGKWVFQWYDLNGKKRKRRLGSAKQVTKSEAQTMVDKILVPINAAVMGGFEDMEVDRFVKIEFFPWFRRKWKNSTRSTTEDRINRHIVPRFTGIHFSDVKADDLQKVLDDAAAERYSRNTVNHLRWDLKHIFRYAASKYMLKPDPAAELFTPRECVNQEVPIMTLDQVNLGLTVLPLRERLIYELAVIAGMRPGEIVALKRKSVNGMAADIRQRIYRGELDTPKSRKSIRQAALANSVLEDLRAWLQQAPDMGPEGWLFPSANLKTAISRDNLLTRCIHPRLDTVGLGWVNFLVLRKTHSNLMLDEEVDAKIIADQQGHTVDVNLNVYGKASLKRKKNAVDKLDAALSAAKQSQSRANDSGSTVIN